MPDPYEEEMYDPRRPPQVPRVPWSPQAQAQLPFDTRQLANAMARPDAGPPVSEEMAPDIPVIRGEEMDLYADGGPVIHGEEMDLYADQQPRPVPWAEGQPVQDMSKSPALRQQALRDILAMNPQAMEELQKQALARGAMPRHVARFPEMVQGRGIVRGQ